MSEHSYRTSLRWDGSTADGVRSYRRDHTVQAPPATTEVALSAAPGFRGDPERLNPEQLVVMAASSCQLLSFLGAAARAGVTVLGYEDEASAGLALDVSPARLSTIHLAVTVRVAPGTDGDRVRELAELAHRECYVANSLAVPVEMSVDVVTR